MRCSRAILRWSGCWSRRGRIHRRQAMAPEDTTTEQFRAYEASQQAMNHAATPYDDIPKNQIYDTVIVARASLEGAMDELKVVAVVHSGDEVRRAKELV